MSPESLTYRSPASHHRTAHQLHHPRFHPHNIRKTCNPSNSHCHKLHSTYPIHVSIDPLDTESSEVRKLTVQHRIPLPPPPHHHHNSYTYDKWNHTHSPGCYLTRPPSHIPQAAVQCRLHRRLRIHRRSLPLVWYWARRRCMLGLLGPMM
jgi:hypothetical protein